MKHFNVMAGVATLALSVALVGCGADGKSAAYTQTPLSEDSASGIQVVAENAHDQKATNKDVLTVNDGELIIVSPLTEKGSFHVTITSSDGFTTVYDEDVDGTALKTVDAGPGTYSVSTQASDVTGSIVISTQNAEEFKKQNDELDKALGNPTFDVVTDEDGMTHLQVNGDSSSVTQDGSNATGSGN